MKHSNGEISQEWKCPFCNHKQVEWFEDDSEYEGKSQIVCEYCDRWSYIDDLPEFSTLDKQIWGIVGDVIPLVK